MSEVANPADADTQFNVAELVAQLTLEEKASLCHRLRLLAHRRGGAAGHPAIMVSDGPHGLRAPARRRPTTSDRRQRAGHLLPDRVGARHRPGTGAAVPRSARRSAREARASGVSVVLGPGINIKRSPLCGRNFEYLSEDPYLAGELATAIVQGIQSLGRRHVAEALRGQQPGGRPAAGERRGGRADAAGDLSAGLRAGGHRRHPWTVMCAYNKVNGTYASEHHWLLTEVLRDEWGFDGVVVSDWGAVHDRVAALAAGLDLEMPPNLGVSEAAVVAAVNPATRRVGARSTP